MDLRDPDSAGLAARLAKSGDKAIARMATIRLGDHHLIAGRTDEAMRCYTSDEGKNSGFEGRLPAIDRAHSLAIEALVKIGQLDQARSKLRAWEIAHSAANIEGDQLFWRPSPQK